MNKSKVFYYVESAPQILSAYKQIKQNGIEQFDMLVRLNGSHYNDSQIQQVLQDLGIRKHGNVLSQLLGFRFVAAFLRFVILNRYTDFCIADIRSPIAMVAIVLARCKRFILLDDGTASFTYYQRKVEGHELSNAGFGKGFITKLAEKRLKQITLHTMLPLKSVGGILVEYNNYKFKPIHSKRKVLMDDRQAVFIGSKVVEAGICSSFHFDTVMRKFAAEFNGFKLIYVAHREEGLAKFNKFPEIEVLRLSRPLELEFGVLMPIPLVACTFYSAGIIHFYPYKDKVLLKAYDIPLEPYNYKYHRSISDSKLLFKDIFNIKIVEFI